MFEELTGKEVEAIVTLIAVSNGTSQLFVEQPTIEFVDKLQELRSEYKTTYGV